MGSTDSGQHAQALFEALFPEGYTPKIDNRTPSEVEAGLSANEARELREAA